MFVVLSFDHRYFMELKKFKNSFLKKLISSFPYENCVYLISLVLHLTAIRSHISQSITVMQMCKLSQTLF